jgi:hypothetical protein
VSITLNIDLGRARESPLRTLRCSGTTVSYRAVKTGKPGRLGFDVFFFAPTADPERSRFLGIWQGATASDAVESFKRSRRCKTGAEEFSPRKSYRRFKRRHPHLRAAGRLTKRGLKAAGHQARRGLKAGAGYAYRKL